MKTILIYISLLILLFNLAEARRILVSKGGKYPGIKSAVQAASYGDTIFVAKGEYRESGIVIEKKLTIIGYPGAYIKSSGNSDIFIVKSDSVNISGFVLTDVPVSYTTEYAAIKLINADYCNISGNMLFNNFFGIYLSRSAHCIISSNLIIGSGREEASSGNAIHLWDSDYNVIEKNILSGHRDGIYLEFVNKCRIESNYSQSNVRYGLHFMYSDTNVYIKNIFNNNGAGVAVMYSRYVVMAGNIFINNKGSNSYGLLLKEIFDSEMFNNHIINNTYGIFAEGITRLTIEDNEFKDNGWAMKILGSCVDNTFTHNNFIGNSFDVSTNTSSNANLFTENYWDKYTGYDLDGDNIGDVPYHPVKLFSFITSKVQESLVLINSMFVDLVNFGESISPVFTPKTLIDAKPLMRRI
jgi:nitrous oxidase accessory protein